MKKTGGSFIIQDLKWENIFIPEDFNEEQHMIRDMVVEFMQQEVYPKLDAIDKMEEGLMESLLDKAGEQGLLGASIPEHLGGFGKGFTTGLLINEYVGSGHSFAVAQAAHTGIGTLPILYFGNEDQKNKYLPDLASGKRKASYCLTEPGSGSDALAAKTKAVLNDAGSHYILNGQKMWITNAGFADIFIVFAKINGTDFTGFIVEKDFEGLSLGPEEHKMGIKGSSTRQVFFNDCKVPVENVLGAIGQGHKIAFNILNVGRIKLGAAALGAGKNASTQSIQYALERKQFGKTLSEFGAIKHKLAEQAIQMFALESALYRCSKDVEDLKTELIAEGQDENSALLGAAEAYAVEAAIIKVFGSEATDFVVDEAVQVFGGYGFSEEYPVARGYRDSRINRIFEGTNEINRLLSIDMLVKKAMKGQLDLLGPAMAVRDELMSIPNFDEPEMPFGPYKSLISNLKKACLMVAGATVQKLGPSLEEEQEIVMHMADMLIQCYVGESVLLRVEKLVNQKGMEACQIPMDIMRTYLHQAAHATANAGREAVSGWAESDELRMMLMGIKRFTKAPAFNAKNARRRIAQHLCQQGKYHIM